MNEKKNYSGGITCEQFLFHEMRITAALLMQGLSCAEVQHKVYRENLFQYPTERTIKRIANACLKRIDAMESDELTAILANGSVSVAKQIALYAMMKQNSIVQDFMIYIIGEKYRTQDFVLTKKDMNLFFLDLQERVESTASWTDKTIGKIKQILLKILAECGYLENTKSEILQPVYLYLELEKELTNKGEFEMMTAFNYFI